jgi:asparagine synthase (glutamine-hydrolysing)
MQKCGLWYNLVANKVCGIAGIWTRKGIENRHLEALNASSRCISRRGPDAAGTKTYAGAAFAHRRLSIIDTSARANQPMTDPTGRYCLVFNGEIYNHKALASNLRARYGISLNTSSDTEVLLHGLIHEGTDFLPKLNGFFSFCLYDSEEHKITCARDRYGIKPFYYAAGEEEFAFGSSLTSVRPFCPQAEIDRDALSTYLQLSYIPDPVTILQGVKKLEPGHFLIKDSENYLSKAWYTTSGVSNSSHGANHMKEFRGLMDDSVRMRLMADVPVGTFLSGGLDSSVITLLAHRENSEIPAFSIGFPDNPYFDESANARAAAHHIGVRHEVFEVREKDIEAELREILDAVDEPFADSSAVLVNILSQRTRKEVKVALSGDGADELLGGYNKHRALLRSLSKGAVNRTLRSSASVLGLLPASRSHPLFDQLRKIKRYSRGLKLDFKDLQESDEVVSIRTDGQLVALQIRINSKKIII